MKKTKELAILCICVSIIILIFIYFIGSKSHKGSLDKYPTENYKNIFENIKNGDLVFFSGNTYSENVGKWFTDSIFTHVGILFTDENQDVYILDSDVGQKVKDGVRVQLLNDKIKRYKGSKVVGYRPINKEINYNILEEIFNKDKDLDFDCWMLDWILSPLGIGRLFKKDDRVFCSEYIHSVLKRCGVITNNTPSYEISPKYFLNCKKMDNGYSYGDIKYFRY